MGRAAPDRGAARGSRPPDFRKLLGETAWAELPQAVQRRFELAAHHLTRTWNGAMDVQASPFGLVLAQLCRLVGTPLAPFAGAAVPVGVTVRPGPGGALIWDRLYRFAGRPPVLVSSSKVMAPSGELMEVVHGGLGMALDLSCEGGELHFRSRRYFLQMAGVRLPIPLLLTPGAAHVLHAELGGGRFAFTLSFVHPWFGRLFFQTGHFSDPCEEEIRS